MVLLKHYRIVDQIGLVDLTDTIYTEYYMRQRFPFFHMAGSMDYLLDILTYHGLISPSNYDTIQKECTNNDVLVEYIAKNIIKDVNISSELVAAYLASIIINADDAFKDFYFRTDMFLVGAMDISLYDGSDGYIRCSAYERHFVPLSQKDWDDLQTLVKSMEMKRCG